MFPSRTTEISNPIVERVLIALGGLLVTVAPFLTWLHVVILGDFNLTGLLSAAHASAALAYLVSAAGVALVLIALLARSIDFVRMTSLVSGSIILLVGGYATYGLVRAVSGAAGLGQVGAGPLMGVIGAVLLIVSPAVGILHRPSRTNPWWLPAAAALVIASALAWLPYHTGVNNYCSSAVGVAFKNPKLLPSDKPPSVVAAQLQSDQAAVTAAQGAMNSQQQRDGQVTEQQNAADSLNGKAQQADASASNLQSTVSDDQNAISNDQDTLQSDQSTAQADQQTVQDDQTTISTDQTTLQNDQQTLTSDQKAGLDTTYDNQAIATDQQTLSNDQATLSKDQTTVANADQTVQSDQATLNQAQANLASDQNALSAAQGTAGQLDQSAANAENAAQNASQNSTQADQTVQQQLSDAQQQLSTDQQNWQNTYQAELTAARNYNSATSACQHQANNHFIAAGAIATFGACLSFALYVNRRRHGPPQHWYPPAAPSA